MKMLAVALGLIILVSFGCNRSHPIDPSEPHVEEAYQMIDDGQYTEAIDLFWSLLQNEDTPTIRIGLTSAYAARAGILVQSYWDLVLPLIKTQPENHKDRVEKFKKEWKLLILKLPSETQVTLAANEAQILKAYENLENFKTRFEKIPLLTRLDQVGDINMARSIIKDEASRGAHLYRSLLSLVLFRYEANESLNQFNQVIAAVQQTKSCSPQLKLWVMHLDSIATLISDLILDLKISYPNKVNEIEPFEKDFKNHSESINSLNSLLQTYLCR